jgi:hypothetical protein
MAATDDFLAGFDGSKDLDDAGRAGLGIGSDAFQSDHGISADGQGVARHDVDRFTGFERLVGRPIGPVKPGDSEENPGPGFGGSDGIAFRCRPVEGGEIDVGDRRFGEDQSQGVDQRDLDGLNRFGQ